MTSLNFPWRPPLANDWADRLAEIEAVLADGAEPDYVAVKTLANQQLGMREQLRTERLAKKLQKADFPNSQFTPVKLGLLGSRTLSYLPAPLAAAGLARGLSISSVEAPYDSVGSFAFSPADCFGCALDALLVAEGAAGEVVQIGHHEEANIPIYMVEFSDGPSGVDGAPPEQPIREQHHDPHQIVERDLGRDPIL